MERIGLSVVSNYAFMYFQIFHNDIIYFNNQEKNPKNYLKEEQFMVIYYLDFNPDFQKMLKDLVNWVLPLFSLIRPLNTIKAIIFILHEYNYRLQIILFDQRGEFKKIILIISLRNPK